jgi:signal transduction histidine kinase
LKDATPHRRGLLFAQLRWFIRLRWVAAATVIAGAIIERALGWYGTWQLILIAGLMIGAYNVLLAVTLPRVPRGRQGRSILFTLTVTQLLLDMAWLSAMVVWTGGARSPLLAFFVFHMVFASLLLPPATALAGSAAACAMIPVALAFGHKWPAERADSLQLVGLLVTLVLTVTLTNRVTHSLRQHRRRLVRQNHRVRAMTEELRRQQQALVQHEKMVAMGQMAAGVTHEITNPLASMDSILQLVERNPDRFGPEKVKTLRDQIRRINQIIQQMKTFAHPAEMQSQTMPVDVIVEQALEMVRFDPRLKKVTIEKHYDPHAGTLTLLPQALQQVLVNLIINAMDAMAGVEHPTLTIRTHRRESGCTIDVSDNGAGIRPEHLAHLFEPFFTTKPVGKGTGLGLSISYSLMQKQGGSISVRSSVGEGSTFTVRLPTNPSPLAPLAEPATFRNREAAGAPISSPENPSA